MQVRVHCREYLSRQVVGFQQAAEIEGRGFIRQRAGDRQTGELAQRHDLVQRFLHPRIAQPEPVLHQVDTQHRGQRIRSATAPGLGVHRLDQGQQCIPGDDLFHFREKHFPPCALALAVVPGIAEGELVHAGT